MTHPATSGPAAHPNRTFGFYPQMQQWFPEVLWKGHHDHDFALTFDDGPHPVDTPQLLKVLEKHGVKATFFWLGEKVRQHPELVRAAAAAGHQLAVHGFTHQPFPFLKKGKLRDDLDRTRDLIVDLSGLPAGEVRDLRPPYGVFTPPMLRDFACWDYRPVLVTSVPVHWYQSLNQTVQQVMRHATGGMVLDLHEGQPFGPAVASLADALIPQLQDQGFEFVTIEDMWQHHLPSRAS